VKQRDFTLVAAEQDHTIAGAAARTTRIDMRWTSSSTPECAVVHLNEFEQTSAAELLPCLGSLPDYDRDPSQNEVLAAKLVYRALPDVVRALSLLNSFRFPLIIVKGLPAPSLTIRTPKEGAVDEIAVKPHVGFLSGLCRHVYKSGAFAYATENQGRILRAVAPIPSEAGKASSQGFDNDLGWHHDNAHYPMIIEPSFVCNGPFMNPIQAFVAIHTRDDVPMELTSLDTILSELETLHGSELVRLLCEARFAVRWPASHTLGGRIATRNVPVLVADRDGYLHSRFHLNNIVAEHEGASYALDRLRAVVASHEAELCIVSDPGDLIIYSNTRMMHHRRCYAPRFDGADRYYVRAYFAPLSVLGDNRVIG
jgi:hypothetical protein